MRRRVWVGTLVQGVVFIGLLFVFGLYQTRLAPIGSAPGFSAPASDGGRIHLKDYLGAPVLLRFWATWCGICGLEQDNVEAIAEDYRVVNVAIQSGGVADVRRFLREHAFRFRSAVDTDGAIAKAYGVRNVPATFVLSQSGEIDFATVGYSSEWGLRARLLWSEWRN